MNHDHSDSRLSCTDCNEPICPKCMVQCAVGNRCKKCADKFSTHLVKLTPAVIAKVVALSFVSAYLILAAEYVAAEILPLYFIHYIAVGAAAYGLGGIIHRVSGYKDGKRLAPFILIPLFLGFVLNPFAGSLISYFQAIIFSHAHLNFSYILHYFFTPILSCFMILVPINRTR